MRRVVRVNILILSVIAWSATLAGCRATKEAYLAKGNGLFDAGKYDDASLNYRKAIQKDPNFGEAYYRLGLTAAKLDQAALAYQALLQATQLMPANISVKEHFGDVCLSWYLADPSHARVLYDQITKTSDQLLAGNPNSYEGLLLKGYLASSDNKPAPAIEFFRKALHVNGSNPGVVTELAHLLIQNGQIEQGRELALDLITRKNTSYGPIYDLLYAFYMNANQAGEAEDILKRKVQNNPKRGQYVIELARHYSRQRKPAEMQAALQQLLGDPVNFPEARLQVGDFFMDRKEYAQAALYYQEGLNAHPNAKLKLAYQKRSFFALLGQGNKPEAIRLAAQIAKENPKDTEALRLHADILLDSGKREYAEVVIREFQALLAQNPNDAALYMQLGLAYRLKGDLNAAHQQFIEATNRKKDLLAARYALAEVSLTQQRPADALQQANKILELRPNDRHARLLRTAGLIGTGDGISARAELLQLIKDSPRDLEPQLQLGLLAVAEKKYPEAIDILGKRHATADPRLCKGLATAYLHQNEFGKAREVLNEGLKNSPDSAILLEQQADTETLAANYDVAIGDLQKLLAADPKSVRLLGRLAEVYRLKGDPRNEIAFYQRASQLAPDDPNVALGLAAAFASAGRTKEARAEFQHVIAKHPENAAALNNTAFFLADTGGDLDEALRLAKRALRKPPASRVSPIRSGTFTSRRVSTTAPFKPSAIWRESIPPMPSFTITLD